MELSHWHSTWSLSSGIDLLRALQKLRVLKIPFDEFKLDCISFTADGLKELLAVASPRMRVHASLAFHQRGNSFDFIRNIGCRLRVLNLECELTDMFPDDVAEYFGGLEELTVFSTIFTRDMDHANVMESMFAVQMKNLQKLSNNFMIASMLLPTLSNVVSSVREVDFDLAPFHIDDVSHLPMKSTELDYFLQKNKQLSSIRICYYAGDSEDLDTEPRMTDEMVELLRKLKICPELSDVRLFYTYENQRLSREGLEKLRNDSVSLRWKRINLSANGEQLLPEEYKESVERKR